MLKIDGFACVIMAFIGYAVFMTITALVILLMDVLECFLHSLCLLWVEFQNMFNQKADGFKLERSSPLMSSSRPSFERVGV